MKLSVGFPVFNPNRAHFEAAIKAVFEALSTVSDFEVFITDDSKLDIVESWVEEWGFSQHVRYIKNPEKLGIGGNWNRVVDLAKGDFVHVMHQDDLIKPAFYVRLLEIFARNPSCGLVYSRTAYIDESGNHRAESRVHHENEIISEYGAKFHDLEIVPSAWLMRTSAVRQIGKFDERLVFNLDREFIFRMSQRFAIGFCGEVLNNYRHSDQTQTSRVRRSGMQFIDKDRAMEIMLTYSPAKCQSSVMIQKKRNLKAVKAFLLEKGDDFPSDQRRALLKILPQGEKVVYLIRKSQAKFRNYGKRIRSITSLTKKVWLGKGDLKLVIGASGKGDPGWILTDIDALDITKYWNWMLIFGFRKPVSVLAEHVWEHLTPSQGLTAAMNVQRFLANGGVFRVAVPDGNSPDPEYINYVKPGGHGAGAHDHKLLYTISIMKEMLLKAGFSEVKGIEYFDEKGQIQKHPMSPEFGTINRSIDNDKRNKERLTYTSLIVDAIK